MPAKANRSTILIGAATVAMGAFLMLLGCGVVAAKPGDAPLWLGVCAGLAFIAAGVALLIRGFSGAPDQSSDLPDGTPRWMNVAYWMTTLVIVVTLSAMGTWVAFGPGVRHFTVAGIISGSVGEIFGRAMFGLGAVLSWIIVAVFAREALRRMFAPSRPPA